VHGKRVRAGRALLADARAQRHAVGAQEIVLRQADLQRVETENVGDGRIDLPAFPIQHVTPERGDEPVAGFIAAAWCV
jgi:hypothetical protein